MGIKWPILDGFYFLGVCVGVFEEHLLLANYIACPCRPYPAGEGGEGVGLGFGVGVGD